MSTLQVSNIHLESTANNRIQYNGSNSYLIVAGGTTIATVNSSGLTVTGNSNFDSGVLFVDGTNNKVGVNTASPSVSLQIAANDALIVPIGTDAQRPTAANGMLRYSTTSNAFEGYANGAWGAIGGGGSTITNDTTTNSNTNYLVFANTSSGSLDDALISTTKLYYNPSTGQLNATNFNSLSDREKKDNIEVITDALDLVNNINGVRFTWKENGLPSAGLIAQELKTIMPELVGDDMSVNYSGVIGLLVECIKELNEKINDLQSK